MKLHKEEKMVDRHQAANMLREIADMMEKGSLSYGKQYLLPDRLEAEVELEKDGKYELEIEFSWYDETEA